jgi:hypothetical protein
MRGGSNGTLLFTTRNFAPDAGTNPILSAYHSFYLRILECGQGRIRYCNQAHFLCLCFCFLIQGFDLAYHVDCNRD